MTIQFTMDMTDAQAEAFARMIAAAMPKQNDREKAMIERYGETCTFQQAMSELGITRSTLYRWMEEGRFSRSCSGARVDVRSLAKYMNQRK